MSDEVLQAFGILASICMLFLVVGALMYLLIPEIRQAMKDDWNRG